LLVGEDHGKTKKLLTISAANKAIKNGGYYAAVPDVILF